ncbi:MAG: 8-amino-7-oxononanoate synthase [Planctomycetota bacterium]
MWRERISGLHNERQQNRLWRNRIVSESGQGPLIWIDGREFLNFCSNDYLGLASRPELAQAAKRAGEQFGVGSGAAHLICGHHALHHQLEERLADWLGAEKALLFSTGYMANLAVAQAFLKSSDLLFQDRLNHASLIDAGRTAPARMVRYQHADANALRSKIERHLSRLDTDAATVHPGLMIATDSVFSMDGDVAPLNELHALARQHQSLLWVDEAHGLGVLGDQGRGALAAHQIAPTENVFLMGTLGKAFGSFGAFVAGDQIWIDHLIQFARTYIYTTALPPMVAATSLAALQLIQHEPQLQSQLKQNIESFRQLLQSKSDRLFSCLKPSLTPIQPLVIGSPEATLAASQHLREQGILVSAIRPPTVPNGESRLRITISATHTTEQIQQLVDALLTSDIESMIDSSGGPHE